MTTINRRNFFTITPIFVIVVLSIGVLKYFTEKRELKWGLQEEAVSLGYVISEYITDDQFKALYRNKQQALKNNPHIAESLIKLGKGRNQEKGEQIKQLYLVDKSCNKIVSIIKKKRCSNSEDGSSCAYVYDAINKDDQINCDLLKKNVTSKKPLLTNVYPYQIKEDDGQSSYNTTYSLSTYIKVVDDIFLGLEVDALTYHKQLQQMILSILIILIIVFMIATIVSMILSRIISSEVKVLREGNLDNVNSEEEIKSVTSFYVQEVDDLNTTFSTMKSILNSIFNRTFKNIISSNKYTQVASIIDKYSSFKWSFLHKQKKSVEYLVYPLDENNHTSFWDSVEIENHTFIFFGNIPVQAEDGVAIDVDTIRKNIIHLNSIAFIVKKVILSNKELDVKKIEVFLKDLKLDHFVITHLLLDKKELHTYTLNSKSMMLEKTVEELQPNKFFLQHTLNEEIDSKIKNYMKFLDNTPIEFLYKELKTVIGSSNGLLSIIKYKG